ncbi:MAG: phosphonate C-P lyase system protein PhnG [Spirochaetes bacterium]|nr:phosphonate C-P lyase system protein PhnG [Spirochaetota bacterium]
MDKKEIFEILMQSDSVKISEAVKKISEKNKIELVKKPEEGLLMFRAVESVEESEFNVGEVLITECEVKINESTGYSMILGIDQKKAYDCAVIMACIEADTGEKEYVLNIMNELKAEFYAKYKFEKEVINSTSVKFDLMGGQDKSGAHNKA